MISKKYTKSSSWKIKGQKITLDDIIKQHSDRLESNANLNLTDKSVRQETVMKIFLATLNIYILKPVITSLKIR